MIRSGNTICLAMLVLVSCMAITTQAYIPNYSKKYTEGKLLTVKSRKLSSLHNVSIPIELCRIIIIRFHTITIQCHIVDQRKLDTLPKTLESLC